MADQTEPVEETLPHRALRNAMVLQFAAGGAIWPFVTLVMRDRGLSIQEMSRILSISSALLMVFPMVWGMLADRHLPLNRLFTILNLGAGTALMFFAFERTFWGVLVSFAAFHVLFNPTLTLINALCFHHVQNVHAEFGHLRSWGSLGWIIPFLPISLWLTLDERTSFEFVVYLAIALCFLMAAFSLRLPHTEPGSRQSSTGPCNRKPYGQAIRSLLTDSNFVAILISLFLVAGSFSLLTFYSPALLEDLGVPRPWIGPIQAIGVLFEIVLLRWQPYFLNRWTCASIILAGCLALVLRQFLFSTVDSFFILATSYLLAAVVIVCFHSTVAVLVNSLADLSIRSTAQSLTLMVNSGLGPMCANWLVSHFAGQSSNKLRMVFLLGTALAMAATVPIALRVKQLNAASRTQRSST